ncbi:MAG: STAS domain-containing protein [Eubacteriales bacterium]|nr:STAS domain-containing protein [Eubacteriales bacterium]
MEPVFETVGTCLKVMLPGEVDHPVSEKIRRETDRIMGRLYIRTMEFDFSKTDFMDSSGIGLLMGRYRALGMVRGCIRAVHVSGYINKLLHLSGVHRFIEISQIAEEREGELHGEYQ